MQLLFVLALALVAAYANAFATNAATLAQNGWSWGWTSGYNNYQVRTPNGYVAISWAATVFDAMYGGVNWSSWTASGYSYWDVLAMSAGTYTWTTGTFSWWWTPNGWWGNTPSGSMRSAAWIWSWLYGTDDYSDDYWTGGLSYTWGTYGWSSYTMSSYSYWSYTAWWAALNWWGSWSYWASYTFDDSYWFYTVTWYLVYSLDLGDWVYTLDWGWVSSYDSYSSWGSWSWGTFSYWSDLLDARFWDSLLTDSGNYVDDGWNWWYSYTLVWVKLSNTANGDVVEVETTANADGAEVSVEVNRLTSSSAPNESSASITKHVALALASMVAIALCM